jgi:AcrR family transcriptional regulator
MRSLHITSSSRRAAVPLQPNRRERRRVETRERIYRAALKIFAERGYLETTVENITEAADVGKGTFFNYFPTKEHVLATYGEQRVDAIERALKKARSTNQSVVAVLKELATNLAGQSSQSPDLLSAGVGSWRKFLPSVRKKAKFVAIVLPPTSLD